MNSKMIKASILLFIFILVSSYGMAQQPSPNEQALGERIMQEINASVSCRAAQIAVQNQLTAVKAELQAMKDRYEPKSEEAKPETK